MSTNMSMTSTSQREQQTGWPRWANDPRIVLALLALWLLATMAWRPLLLPDEGRYAGVAREMMVSGDAWLPTLNGLPYFHKPPLMYWIDIAAMHVFGVNEFAARFAPFIGAWLMGAALYLHLHRHHGARTAAIALAVLASCPGYFIAAQYANHDMLVAGLITLAALCAVRAFEDVNRVARRWLLASWGACALAVLAKGLIGFVLPGLVVLPWLLMQRRWRHAVTLLWPPALVVFVLIAAPWFVQMQRRFPEFLDYFFVEQHFRRFAQTGFNNVRGAWFYFAVLPLLSLPWIAWLPRLVMQWRRSGAPSRLAPLYLWWVVAVVGFFSLPASKLVGYVLPAMAPLVALLGVLIAQGHAWRWVLALSAAGCVAIVGVLAFQSPNSHRDVALALAARMQAGDRVAFIDERFFDIPFYAQLQAPPIVVSRWRDPTIAQNDDWRKELSDAARFDATRGAQLLVPDENVAQLLCGNQVTWIVSGRNFKGQAPWSALANVPVVFEGRNARLMRAAPTQGCP